MRKYTNADRASQDHAAILELSARYNLAADSTDGAAVAALFTQDGTVEMFRDDADSVVYAGPDLAKLAAPYEGQRVHVTTNHVVVVDADKATQLSTLLLITRSRSKGLSAIFTGRYEDEIVMTTDGWRFTRRVVRLDSANAIHVPLATGVD